jgi:hypothetical protein
VVAESLRWLDRYVNGEATPGEHSVRVHVGGAGEWRELPDWPPGTAADQRWYPGANGTLSPQSSASSEDASFRYDPADPTPTVGGAIMVPVTAGMRDNRAIERRPDVLTFSSEPLDHAVEILGDVSAELSVTRDNSHADLFVRLYDVDPRGRSHNVCDGVVRLTDTDPLAGTVTVSLLGTAYRFRRGHRIRMQVAGGAHPRFARNPGNGKVDAPAGELVPTRYRIGTSGESVLLLGGKASR